MKWTNYQSGLLSELIAKIFLRLKFYNIVACRYRDRLGEIDLIASKNKCLVFVEVKYRKKIDLEFYPLQPKQISRIRKAAMVFIAKHPRYQNYQIRFDYIEIQWLHIRHTINAF